MLETKEEIEQWLRANKIDKFQINVDSSIDVNGHVDLRDKQLTSIPVRFNNVSGNFNVSRNVLSSLDGAPKYVGGWFFCAENELTSLSGAPEVVKGSFGCSNNKIQSLEGAPINVGGYFDCEHNNLTSLQHSPRKIGGSLHCCSNPIENLGDIDTEIGGVFLSPQIAEFAGVAEKCLFDVSRVLTESFNTKVQELKRIREEKALFESSIAKVFDTPPLGSASPLAAEPLQQPRAKPKFKL
jgi:hypothetical protein